MGQIAEDSLWYKGKAEVLREYAKNRGAILSTVAAKNFSGMPGFAVEAFTDIEIDSKLKLTDYNHKLMGEAIERELKALGLSNDISLKQATMAWELEKVGLFSDLQKEFADNELIRSLREEDIAGLMILQEIREVGVLMAKTVIEIDIEEVKRQKTEVELLPLPYEDQLARARLATATRKLDVIPYILAALAAQRTVIDTEAAVILPAREQKANYDKETADRTVAEILPLMEGKALAGQNLIAEQETLLAPMEAKTTATQNLTAALYNLIAPMTQKAEATTALAAELQTLILPMTNKATAVDNLTAALETLSGVKGEKSTNLAALVAKEGELITPQQQKAAEAQTLAAAQHDLLTPMTEKATAAELLADRLSDLFQPMLDKAAASTELATEMIAQLANHISIATEKIALAQEEVKILQEKTVLMEKEVTLDEREVTIKTARAQLEVDRAQAKVDIATALQIQLGLIKTAMDNESQSELLYIGAVAADEVTVKSSYITVVEAAKFAAQKTELQARTNSLTRQTSDDATHNAAMIRLNASVQMAEKLIHLLS